jgi:hypothetical protein
MDMNKSGLIMERLLYYAVLLFYCAIIVISPYSRAWVKWLLYASIGVWLIAGVLNVKENLVSAIRGATGFKYTFLLIVIACCGSLAFSLNFYHSQKIFFNRYLIYFASYCIGFWLLSKNQYRERAMYCLIAAIILAGGILAVGCIRDYIVLQPSRLFSAFGKDIAFAMLPLFLTYYLALIYGFCLFLKNRILSLCASVVFAALVPCVAWQGGRTPWVACAAAIILLSYVKNSKYFYYAFCSFLLILAVVMFNSDIRAKLETIPNPSEWNHRTPLYDSAIKMFIDKPIFGTGLGMYEVLIKTDRYKLPDSYPNPDRRLYLHAHNLYFETIAEMGIMGLAALSIFFGAVFVLFRRFLKRQSSTLVKTMIISIAGMVAATLISGITGSLVTVGMNETLLFWIMLGVGAGLLNKGEMHNGGDAWKSG